MTSLTLVDVSSKTFDEVCKLLAATHPHECVISIYVIHNPKFEQAFADCQAMLTTKRGQPPTQMRAFHGCSLDSAYNIVNHGFDQKYNTISAYGKGTYFSGFYNVSRGYSLMKKSKETTYHSLIVADILLGKLGTRTSTDEIDACVDNLKKPSIIALPINEAAIPRYLVQFYAGAK
jgi:hypothetical protein